MHTALQFTSGSTPKTRLKRTFLLPATGRAEDTGTAPSVGGLVPGSDHLETLLVQRSVEAWDRDDGGVRAFFSRCGAVPTKEGDEVNGEWYLVLTSFSRCESISKT